MNKNWAIAGIILAITILTTASVLALSPSAEAVKPQPPPPSSEVIKMTALGITGSPVEEAIFNNV